MMADNTLVLARKLTAGEVAAIRAKAGPRSSPDAEADREAALQKIIARRAARNVKRGAASDDGAALMKAMGLEWIAAEFKSAFDTMRIMPANHCWPASGAGWWPEIIRSVAESYAYAATHVTRATPTADQISRMDRAMGWLGWLEQRERKVVLLRSAGRSFAMIGKTLGIGKTTAQTDHIAALITIAFRLSSTVRRK
jgi:hypothetical protein